MRGIYSNTRTEGDKFIKDYDEVISPGLVRQEYFKVLKIHELGLGPRPLSFDDRTIVIEKINRPFTELLTFLWKNNNKFRKHNKELIKQKLYLIGRKLSLIHESLELESKEGLGWLIVPQRKVFLYGDLGLRSILIKGDDLIFIDPSFNIINSHVNLYDSFYYDLAYFIFSLKYLIPLKWRSFYLWNNTKSFVDSFIAGYRRGSPDKIIPQLLRNYELKVKEEYLKTCNVVWRRIINDAEPYKEVLTTSWEIRDIEGIPVAAWK